MAKEPDAFVLESLFEAGIGEVVIVRYKGGGRAEAGVFLVDPCCLGVKDAFFVSKTEEELQKLLDKMGQRTPLVRHPAPYGRKLVEEAVKYARELGFEPHRDFKKAARVFGGIDPARCGEKFVFGRDGKPFFVNGPHISYDQSVRIIKHLEVQCGAKNFEYLIGRSKLDGDDMDEEDCPFAYLSDSANEDGEDTRGIDALEDEMADMPDFKGWEFENGDNGDTRDFNLARHVLTLAESLQEHFQSANPEATLESMVQLVIAIVAISKMDENKQNIFRKESPELHKMIFDSISKETLAALRDSFPPARIVHFKFIDAPESRDDRPELLLAYVEGE